MIRATRRSVIVLLAVGLLLLSGTTAFAKNGGVPFKVSFSGSAGFADQVTTQFSGTGNASHLGRITTSGLAHICYAPNAWPGCSSITDIPCAGGIPNVHDETLTAANGDTLLIESLDVACPTAPNQYDGVGHWAVVGGTGRFSDATGSGSFGGHSNFNPPGTFALSLDGTIDY